MVLRLFIQTAVWIAVMGALLFLAAGTIRWPVAWIFLAEMGVLGLGGGLWVAKHDPALLAERLKSPIQRDQPRWDKILMSIFLTLSIVWFPMMGLDAVRFGASNMPVVLQVFGALGTAVSILLGIWVMRENSFAAPVVKLQSERGHRVVTSGPYQYVRHPMYAGALLYLVGTPLLLGSRYGLALALVLIVLLGYRAWMEERTLASELDGYAAYAARVRSRLIPYVW